MPYLDKVAIEVCCCLSIIDYDMNPDTNRLSNIILFIVFGYNSIN